MLNEETVTQLLSAAEAGDGAAYQRLYALTYDELRGLARRVRASGGATLNTTALVHEAYLKLVPRGGPMPHDRLHFFRIAARAMRQVLVDAARRRATRRRGAEVLGFDTAFTTHRSSLEVLELESALTQLESISRRQAEVIECRFFAGLSVEETAHALGISTPTVKREWRVARAWLATALNAPLRADAQS